MRKLEPTFPSFSLVITEAFEAYDPLLLPPYQTAHLEAYHPYSASPPMVLEDPLMTTVDYRYEDPPLYPIAWHDAPELEEIADNLQTALQLKRGAVDCPVTKRIRFPALVIDLALTIRRKCQGVLPGRKMKTMMQASRIDLVD